MATVLAGLLSIIGSASAQVGGSVTITGHVSPSISLRYHVDSLLPGTSGSNAAGLDQPLLYTMDLGDMLPPALPATSSMRGGTIWLALRSNLASCTVTGAVGATSNLGGPGQPTLADIGFGVPGVVGTPTGVHCSGVKCNNASQVASTTYHNNPTIVGDGATITDDVATFLTSLNTLSGSGQILAPPAQISTGGGFNSNNNALLVPITYAMYPQLWAESGGFSVEVTYTIAGP